MMGYRILTFVALSTVDIELRISGKLCSIKYWKLLSS